MTLLVLLLKFSVYIEGLNNMDYYDGRPVPNLTNLRDVMLYLLLVIYRSAMMSVFIEVTYVIRTFRQFLSSKGDITKQKSGFKSRYEILHQGILNVDCFIFLKNRIKF